jgi:hypothetical protein
VEGVFGILAAVGALLMAHHTWHGLRYYDDKFWRWAITFQLSLDAIELFVKAFQP